METRREGEVRGGGSRGETRRQRRGKLERKGAVWCIYNGEGNFGREGQARSCVPLVLAVVSEDM